MAVEDVIEEPVVVEPVVEIEPTKDEAILLEIQKSKQEALEAKKLVEDMKALLEAKEKNEKTVQELTTTGELAASKALSTRSVASRSLRSMPSSTS